MNATEIVLFESSDGIVTLPVEVDVTHNEIWLTRQDMAQLFGRDVKTIGKHINNALREELAESENRVVAKFSTTAAAGKRYRTEHYGVDMVLSVGYRVKSKRGIEFRTWANSILRSYLTKGYAANERRLKQLGQVVGIMSRLPTSDLGVRQVLDIVRSHGLAVVTVAYL